MNLLKKDVNHPSDNSRHKLVRGPLQRRFLLMTLASTLIICVIISLLSYYLFRNYLQNALLNSTATNLANLNEAINSDINGVYRMARYCQSSSNIADYVNAGNAPGAVLSINTYDRLYEEYKNNEVNKYIPRCVIISDSHFLQACQSTFSTTVDLAEAIPKLFFFEQLSGAEAYDFSVGIIYDPFLPRQSHSVIPIIRPITYKFNSKQGGYLYLEFSTNLFTDQMKKYHMDDGSRLYLLICDHLYLFDDGTLTEMSPSPLPSKVDETYPLSEDMTILRGNINNRKHTYISTKLNMENCFLIQEVSPTTLHTQLNLYILMLAVILILIFAMGIALSVYSDRNYHRLLSKIRVKINDTAAGDFSRDPSIEWNNELGEIGKGINDLSESIDTLLCTRLENEKQKRDLEYKVLQNQINPHFLYNTLNSIKMMASIQGATGIAEMTTALASLLRNISKGDSLLIPISEELALVKDYFTIQNYRYGGMISFETLIEDDSITDYTIVKFTLQPLVENAIFHGLEPKGGIGKISIHLSYVGEDISIEVIDDGVGISEEKLSGILEGSAKDKNDLFKEIGISNVHKRIQYEFGEQYGISIHSTVHKGTTMQVIIPRRK